MRSKVTRSGDGVMETLAEVDQRLDPEPQGSGFVVLPVLVAEHRARDVEVGPGDVRRDELAQEEARGDRAGESPRGEVVDVRERRLQRVAILLDQGQLP